MCEKYKDLGVVGIDIAGDEGSCTELFTDNSTLDDIESEVFQAAKKKGIHRTVHAGEAGPAKAVQMVRN